MKKDAIGTRMKENYEERYRFKLLRRTPVILRLDGNAFHTLLRKSVKPFDEGFSLVMEKTAHTLCQKIQGVKCCYVQSDEMSFLLTDYDRLETSAWFDYNVQKMVSISSGMASVTFSALFDRPAVFDARVFNLPKEEVNNYFVWRQKDWIRNSISMLARAHYSDKQVFKKGKKELLDMLGEKNIHWELLLDRWKYGVFVERKSSVDPLTGSPGSHWETLTLCPIFTDKKETLEKYLSEKPEKGEGSNLPENPDEHN